MPPPISSSFPLRLSLYCPIHTPTYLIIPGLLHFIHHPIKYRSLCHCTHTDSTILILPPSTSNIYSCETTRCINWVIWVRMGKVQASWEIIEVLQGKVCVSIECWYNYYEIILLAIWGTVVISNLQFGTKSRNKYRENIKKGYLIFDSTKGTSHWEPWIVHPNTTYYFLVWWYLQRTQK